MSDPPDPTDPTARLDVNDHYLEASRHLLAATAVLHTQYPEGPEQPAAVREEIEWALATCRALNQLVAAHNAAIDRDLHDAPLH